MGFGSHGKSRLVEVSSGMLWQSRRVGVRWGKLRSVRSVITVMVCQACKCQI